MACELYEKLVPQGAATPLIIVVRVRSSGKLAMVLPLVRRRYMLLKAIEFADMRVSDYVSPVVDEETFSRILARQPDMRCHPHISAAL